MAEDTKIPSQDAELTALDLDKRLNCTIEVNAIQDLSSGSNCHVDEHSYISIQAKQANISISDCKTPIHDAQRHTNEECQASLAKSSALEIVKNEEELEKSDCDENVCYGNKIRKECNENLVETCKQLQISGQISFEINSLDKKFAKNIFRNEAHEECLEQNKCQTPLSSDKHKGCSPDTPRSLGVRKHIIGKTSMGKTNKIVRIDVQSTSPSAKTIKTPYRKKSPLNWFPRTKTETYLQRKIRMLQEAEGIKASLDETLVGSNVVLPRVEREKRAVQAAAKEAMETRKAAFVEASWCRILEAARIPCRLASAELEKAEKKASEAVAKAISLGVTMKSKLSSSKHACEGDSPGSEEGSNHSITASFKTAFEVEKEVVAAVKVAFSRFSQVPDSTSKISLFADEDQSRIKNKSETTEGLDEKTYSHRCCFEARTRHDYEVNRERDSYGSMNVKLEATKLPLENSLLKELPTHDVSEDLVNLMLERMKFLSTEELSSLEEIVSTRGLSALLQEQNEEKGNTKNSGCGLEDVLVKHVSRLEAEKAAASKLTVPSRPYKKKSPHENISDLGCILVKHTSRFEKELQNAKNSSRREERSCDKEVRQPVESLDQVLVKHKSRLEREKLEAAANSKVFDAKKTTSFTRSCTDDHGGLGLGDILKKQASQSKQFFKGYPINKENKDANGMGDISSSDIKGTNISKRESKEQIEGLDKFFIKRISRLEQEKLEAARLAKTSDTQNGKGLDSVQTARINAQENTTEYASQSTEDCVTAVVDNSGFIHSGNSSNSEKMSKPNSSSTAVPDLGSVLTKHVSKLEQEIQAAKRASTTIQRANKKEFLHNGKTQESLDKLLVKRVSRLEQEKLAASMQKISENGSSDIFESQQQSADCHIQTNGVSNEEINGIASISNDEIQASVNQNSHSSCNQRRKERQCAENDTQKSDNNPFPPLIKKMSKLEMEKQQAAALAASGNDPWQRKKSSKSEELQNAWGGLDLGTSLKKHVSRLQLEQAAWRKAEEEERRHPPFH